MQESTARVGVIVLLLLVLVGVFFMLDGDEERDDRWERLWDARQAALEGVLGASDERVLHAVVPFSVGGAADVLVFREHIDGVVYVTADLIGDDSSKPNSLGQYELMICARSDSEWAPGVISNLARYTTRAALEPNDTMDIQSAVPEGSEIAAFVFVRYASIEVEGKDALIMLCVGITERELRFAHESGVEELIAALERAEVYPMTDLARTSVELP